MLVVLLLAAPALLAAKSLGQRGWVGNIASSLVQLRVRVRGHQGESHDDHHEDCRRYDEVLNIRGSAALATSRHGHFLQEKQGPLRKIRHLELARAEIAPALAPVRPKHAAGPIPACIFAISGPLWAS